MKNKFLIILINLFKEGYLEIILNPKVFPHN